MLVCLLLQFSTIFRCPVTVSVKKYPTNAAAICKSKMATRSPKNCGTNSSWSEQTARVSQNKIKTSEPTYHLQQADGVTQRPETSEERDEEHHRADDDQQKSGINRQGVNHIYTHTYTHTQYMFVDIMDFQDPYPDLNMIITWTRNPSPWKISFKVFPKVKIWLNVLRYLLLTELTPT